jgi:hypothetical protein
MLSFGRSCEDRPQRGSGFFNPCDAVSDCDVRKLPFACQVMQLIFYRTEIEAGPPRPRTDSSSSFFMASSLSFALGKSTTDRLPSTIHPPHERQIPVQKVSDSRDRFDKAQSRN